MSLVRGLILCFCVACSLLQAQGDINNFDKAVAKVRAECLKQRLDYGQVLDLFLSSMGDHHIPNSDQEDIRALCRQAVEFDTSYLYVSEATAIRNRLINDKARYHVSRIIKCLLHIRHNWFLLQKMATLNLVSEDYPYRQLKSSVTLDEIEFGRYSDELKIAEIGVADGLHCLLLKANYPSMTVYANELSQDHLEQLRQWIHVSKDPEFAEIILAWGNISGINIDENQLDVILVRNTLHHFSNKKAMLKSIRKHLADEGRLLIVENFNADPKCSMMFGREYFLPLMNENGFELSDSMKTISGEIFEFQKANKKKKRD